MLTAQHIEHPYPAPTFISGEIVIERVSRTPGSVVIVHQLSDSQPAWADGGLDEMTLEQFRDRYLERRDDLALRRLRGEKLTARDAALLDQLNQALDRLLSPRERLPPDVLDAMAEVKRLATQR